MQLASPSSKPRPEPRIPPKIRKAVLLIASGAVTTQKAAAERVGVCETHLSTMMGRPTVRAFLADESRRNIQQATLRASRRLVELIDAKSEHVAAQVSERILTSERILQSDQSVASVSVAVSVGYVVDLTEPTLIRPERRIENNPTISTVSAFE